MSAPWAEFTIHCNGAASFHQHHSLNVCKSFLLVVAGDHDSLSVFPTDNCDSNCNQDNENDANDFEFHDDIS